MRSRHFDSREQQAFLHLWRTYDRLHALEEELFSRYGLTPQQYNALRLLRGAAPQPMPTLVLAGKLVSRAPDITRMLDKLESRRLILRHRPSENRRTVLVSLTDQGLSLLKELDPRVRDCHERQLGHMNAADLQSLIDLLDRARRPHEPADSAWS